MSDGREITAHPDGADTTVSVIVCTLDRPDYLIQCLSDLGEQTVLPNEIIIVSGSDASIPTGLKTTGRNIRIVSVTGRNISISRNAGLREATGQIVAFCDDDTRPAKDWMEKLIAAFVDPTVAGIGGVVYDSRQHPARLDFANGLIRFSGRQIRVRPETHVGTAVPRGWYNNVCGCCCAFRRSSLMEIGGFDEFIEFAFEETDVCFRLARAGWCVVHAPEAKVLHGYAPGGHRDDDYLSRNWYAEIKNQVYCGLKNSPSHLSEARVILRGLARISKLHLRFGRAARQGHISPQQAKQFCQAMLRGLRRGIHAGYRGECQLPFAKKLSHDQPS